jgi:hypothetical protein
MMNLITKIKMDLRDRLDNKYLWVFLILTLLLAIGVIIVPHYGQSVDEWANAHFGELFLQLYDRGKIFRNPEIGYYNGPSYFMVNTVTSRIFSTIFPGWMLTDGRHFTNFLTFLLGGFLIFDLGVRFIGKRGALLSLLIYLSQPLLFGHAFINQKDIPMMTFFLATIVFGMRAIDAWRSPDQKVSDGPDVNSGLLARSDLIREWSTRTRLQRSVFLGLLFVALLLTLDLWIEQVIYPWIQRVLSQTYAGDYHPWILAAFERIATDAYKTPLDLYQIKLDKLYVWGRIPLSILLVGLPTLYAYKLSPNTCKSKAHKFLRKWGPLFLAAATLGTTISIRLVGLLAGAIISVVFLWQEWKRAFLPLIMYWTLALAVTYITWPAIWGNPFLLLADRIIRTTEFTSFSVLYRGHVYLSENLPWHYVPTLVGIQLTLPAVILSLVGIVVLLIKGWKRPEQLQLIFLLGAWIIIPVFAASASLIPIYDNFRHLLFILPPIILLAGVGLDSILENIQSLPGKALLVVLLLLPGVLGVIRLHPYEYIYYNEIVGGVDGAVGKFPLDYWCTSNREAMEFINANAQPDAQVAVWGGLTTAEPFERDDIRVYQDWRTTTQPDYAIGCYQAIAVEGFFPDLEVVHQIRRGTGVLSIVKARQP